MKHLAAAALLLSLTACAAPRPADRAAAAVPNADALILPASQSWNALSTPEGAAEELFRAYIELDAERFRRACARPFGDPRTRAQYKRFIEGAAAEIRKAAGGGLPPQGAPVDLITVHPAEDLPSTFRTAAAYDHMSQRSAVLVEVDAYLAGRGVETSRVIVLRDSAGQWGAAPRPELFGFNLR
jgi:hypothetical protein